MQIPRRMVSAEPGIALHNTKTLLHDLNILFYGPMKFQVLWCTHIEGMKKSTNLHDILQISSMGIESPHRASAVVVQWEAASFRIVPMDRTAPPRQQSSVSD